MSSQVNSLVGVADYSDDDIKSRNPSRWYFDKPRIENTPSRRVGIDSDNELTFRQQSAKLIQDIGQRLGVNQLCISTAIVYMHRFYMYHSFTQFYWISISAVSLFLAAKVEEQTRKLEDVIRVVRRCVNPEQPNIDTKSQAYQKQADDLMTNEHILLQTLGFDVAVDHPHTHVIKTCQLLRASKELGQMAYLNATNSLQLTTMCLQYSPTLVACVCINLACKWSNWEIPRSKEGKDWWNYVDKDVTAEQLKELTKEYFDIFDKAPSRIREKIRMNTVTGNVPPPMKTLRTSITVVDSASTSGKPSLSDIRPPSKIQVSKPGETHGGMMHPKTPQQPQELLVARVPLNRLKQPSLNEVHHSGPVSPESKHGHIIIKSSHRITPCPLPVASARDQRVMSQQSMQQHSNSKDLFVLHGGTSGTSNTHHSQSSQGQKRSAHHHEHPPPPSKQPKPNPTMTSQNISQPNPSYSCVPGAINNPFPFLTSAARIANVHHPGYPVDQNRKPRILPTKNHSHIHSQVNVQITSHRKPIEMKPTNTNKTLVNAQNRTPEQLKKDFQLPELGSLDFDIGQDLFTPEG